MDIQQLLKELSTSYEPPSLIEYGDAAELTLGSSCYSKDYNYGYINVF
ncbi:lasso RiPP family leader peptide-containing protein [Paenibacillus cellulositrophicus]|nr:lasso RiPP family leader peptide-containing protein [Paenibacillus cellulositrophicus]MCM2996925.1 lasso RiPP family leader peptide-containing protein [Paenibacillus cellulositrophicus]